MGGEPTRPTGPRIGWKVYPRVGGETLGLSEVQMDKTGLSPRGRGNLGLSGPRILRIASIPAWAGKHATASSRTEPRGVYPRVGGETGVRRPLSPFPRVYPAWAGNHLRHQLTGARRGSIPAWAGKPSAWMHAGYRRAVYPRVAGKPPAETVTARQSTVYPAWAGKPPAA